MWAKSMPLHELTDQVRLAVGGHPLAFDGGDDEPIDLTEPDPPAPTADLERLTRREHDVLAGLVAGQAPKEIAASLGVAVPTVRTQIRQLFAKLGVNSQRAAVAVALRSGFSPLGDSPRR